VFCDEDYKILSALKVQYWKDRTIKAREQYIYPPASNVDLFDISFEDFCRVMDDSSRDSVVKTLAMDFGLGGVYAEEVCARAGVDKAKKLLDEDERRRIFSAIEDMRKLRMHANISDGEPYPFVLKLKKVEKEFQNFNAALDFYYGMFMKDELAVEKNSADAKLEKQYSILEHQKEQMKTVEKSIEENTLKGNKIYENYAKIDALFSYIRGMREKGVPWSEIKKELKKKSVLLDEKNKQVIVPLK